MFQTEAYEYIKTSAFILRKSKYLACMIAKKSIKHGPSKL